MQRLMRQIGQRRAGSGVVGLLILTLICLTPANSQGRTLTPQAATTISIIGPAILGLNLNQQNSSHWFPYTSIDSPEGGYMGWMFAGETSLTATIPLPQPLAPGTYFVFIKGINYDRGLTATIAGGGNEVTLPTDDRDWNRYWTYGGALQARSTTPELRLTLHKLGPVGEDTKLLLRGLYITDRPNMVVMRTDVAVDLTYPTQMDESQAQPGNIIENGSFEVGLGHGWGLEENRNVSIQSLWDRTQAYHGRASVKLPLDPGTRSYGEDLSLVSKVYTLKPNKQYTLSAWIKTTPGAIVGGRMRITNTFEPPPGYPPQHLLQVGFLATDTWQRIHVTGYLLKYPTSDYQIEITGVGGPGQHLWIDGVQLEEGDGADVTIKPAAPLEVGLVTSQPGRIYYEDEPVTMDLLAFNATAQATTGQVKYEIYDYLNRKVREGSQAVSVGAQASQTLALNLSTTMRGIFRVVLWLDGQDKTREEVVYAIVPRQRTPGADPTSNIGIHSNFQPFQLDAQDKLGIKWDCAMSPAAFFRWSLIEPQDNQFIWYDAEIQRAIDRGITIMGTIGNVWPAWADSGGLPDLDKWEEFVGQVVTHYRGRVRYWEIWNEPSRQFGNQPGLYAQLLKRAVDAIERSDAEAKVVGMGGSSLVYMEQVISELHRLYPTWDWTQHIDALSTHLYPLAEGGAEDFKSRIIDVYHVPVWNTEVGEWDWGLYMGSNANFLAWGENLFPHTDAERFYESSPDAVGNLTKNYLTTIGAGLSNYFYYDSRIIAAPNTLRTQPTILEYDDSIRPKGIAYGILAYFFGQAHGQGRVTLHNPGAVAYLFDRAGVPLVGLWTSDGSNAAITLSLPAAQYKVYDSMGNPLTITNGVIPYGRTPIYIEGQAITADALRTALEAAVHTSHADTTAPSVTISASPVGPTRIREVRVRWIAIDETSVPEPSLPNALLYTYRLSGATGEGAWSAWLPNTYADYTLLPGRYTFSVQAKDEAGNASAIISTPIIILGDVYYNFLPLLNRRATR